MVLKSRSQSRNHRSHLLFEAFNISVRISLYVVTYRCAPVHPSNVCRVSCTYLVYFSLHASLCVSLSLSLHLSCISVRRLLRIPANISAFLCASLCAILCVTRGVPQGSRAKLIAHVSASATVYISIIFCASLYPCVSVQFRRYSEVLNNRLPLTNRPILIATFTVVVTI